MSESDAQTGNTIVYQLVSVAGDVLYVGITSDIAARLQQHSEKEWFARVAQVQCTEHATRAGAAAREAELIRELRPRYNRSHNPDAPLVAREKLPPIVFVDAPVKVITGAKYTERPRPANRARSRQFDAFKDRRRYVSQDQAAEYLGVTTRTIRQMIADGRLKGYRSGRRLVRVDLNEVDAAMKPFGGSK